MILKIASCIMIFLILIGYTYETRSGILEYEPEKPLSAEEYRKIEMEKLQVAMQKKLNTAIKEKSFGKLGIDGWMNFNASQISQIIDAGGNPNEKLTHETMSPLIYALNFSSFEVIETLIQYGADINEKDKDGNNLLVYISLRLRRTRNDIPELIKLFIKNGIDINEKNNKGIPCLSSILSSYDTKQHIIIETLLQNGADPNLSDENGSTPLMYAAFNNKTDSAISLLKNGADINAKNKDGRTPLMFAAANPDARSLYLLLIQKGADINAKDNNGSRIYDFKKNRKPIYFVRYRNSFFPDYLND